MRGTGVFLNVSSEFGSASGRLPRRSFSAAASSLLGLAGAASSPSKKRRAPPAAAAPVATMPRLEPAASPVGAC